MKNNFFYAVETPSGENVTYFETRESAAMFIVDEFGMAMGFRNNEEPMRLKEYMMSHDITPNQYEYKYMIKAIRLCHDYDKPKSLYAVRLNVVRECTPMTDVFIFHDRKDAIDKIKEIAEEDKKNYDTEDRTLVTSSTETEYDRWYDDDLYCTNYANAKIFEFEDDGSTITQIYEKAMAN